MTEATGAVVVVDMDAAMTTTTEDIVGLHLLIIVAKQDILDLAPVNTAHVIKLLFY
jgi:hypothetical protein